MVRRHIGPAPGSPPRVAIAIVAVLVGAAVGSQPTTFTDRPLCRLDGDWIDAPQEEEGRSERAAPATVLFFRSGGEFVEHHCWIIEVDRGSPTISPGDPHVVAVGRWERVGEVVRATRVRIARTVEVLGGGDPLCDDPRLEFTIEDDCVAGSTFAGQNGKFCPMSLQDTNLEAYANEAKRDGTSCESP